MLRSSCQGSLPKVGLSIWISLGGKGEGFFWVFGFLTTSVKSVCPTQNFWCYSFPPLKLIKVSHPAVKLVDCSIFHWSNRSGLRICTPKSHLLLNIRLLVYVGEEETFLYPPGSSGCSNNQTDMRQLRREYKQISYIHMGSPHTWESQRPKMQERERDRKGTWVDKTSWARDEGRSLVRQRWVLTETGGQTRTEIDEECGVWGVGCWAAASSRLLTVRGLCVWDLLRCVLGWLCTVFPVLPFYALRHPRASSFHTRPVLWSSGSTHTWTRHLMPGKSWGAPTQPSGHVQLPQLCRRRLF